MAGFGGIGMSSLEKLGALYPVGIRHDTIPPDIKSRYLLRLEFCHQIFNELSVELWRLFS